MGIPAKIDPVFLDQPRRMGNAQRISVAITHLVPLCAEPARLPPWFWSVLKQILLKGNNT